MQVNNTNLTTTYKTLNFSSSTIDENLWAELASLPTPNAGGVRGLSRLLPGARRERVVLDRPELEALALNGIISRGLSAQLKELGVERRQIAPTNAARTVSEDNRYEMELIVADGPVSCNDPARWTKLGERLPEDAELVGIFRALVVEYEADGHGYMLSDFYEKHDRKLERQVAALFGLESEEPNDQLFQCTGYVLGLEGEDARIEYTSPVVKGMVCYGVDHPHISRSAIRKSGAQLFINANMIKGGKYEPGTLLTVALYKQDGSNESHGITDVKIPWQVLTRSWDVMTDEARDIVLAQVEREFGKDVGLIRGLSDDNAFQDGFRRAYDTGFLPRHRKVRAPFVNVANNAYEVRLEGFRLRLLTSPAVEAGKISLPRRFRKLMNIGDKVTVFRSPFLGIEIEVLEVQDFYGRGIRDASGLTGDSDGDYLTVVLGTLVHNELVQARRDILKATVGNHETGVTAEGLDGLQATARGVLSKSEIGLWDSHISSHVFDMGGVYTPAWARHEKHAQDAVDMEKKNIPGFMLLGRLKNPAPAIYRLLNGKAATLKDWYALLDGARDAYHKIPAPLGNLVKRILRAIPTPVFRRHPDDRDLPVLEGYEDLYYDPKGMPAWTRLLEGMSAKNLAGLKRIGIWYQANQDLMQNFRYRGTAYAEAGMANLRALERYLNTRPQAVTDLVAMTVLAKNPKKIVGFSNPMILEWVPGIEDVVRYYNWVAKHTAPQYRSAHFEPDYGYARVSWTPPAKQKVAFDLAGQEPGKAFEAEVAKLKAAYGEGFEVWTSKQSVREACRRLHVDCRTLTTRDELRGVEVRRLAGRN